MPSVIASISNLNWVKQSHDSKPDYFYFFDNAATLGEADFPKTTENFENYEIPEILLLFPPKKIICRVSAIVDSILVSSIKGIVFDYLKSIFLLKKFQ